MQALIYQGHGNNFKVAISVSFLVFFLAPPLWSECLCISDLPITVSRKYAYADDEAAVHADEDWQTVEGVMSKGMRTVGEYL